MRKINKILIFLFIALFVVGCGSNNKDKVNKEDKTVEKSYPSDILNGKVEVKTNGKEITEMTLFKGQFKDPKLGDQLIRNLDFNENDFLEMDKKTNVYWSILDDDTYITRIENLTEEMVFEKGRYYYLSIPVNLKNEYKLKNYSGIDWKDYFTLDGIVGTFFNYDSSLKSGVLTVTFYFK